MKNVARPVNEVKDEETTINIDVSNVGIDQKMKMEESKVDIMMPH